MTQPSRERDHVQLQLGLYVLGALSADEDLVVEEHLVACVSCRTESLELSEVPALLSLLAPEDVRSLAEEFRPNVPPAPADVTPRPRAKAATPEPPFRAAPARPAMQPRPSRPATQPTSRPTAQPRSSRLATSETPAEGGRVRRGTGGAHRTVHRTRLLISAIALALFAGVGIGIGIASSSPDAITLAGSETNTVTGATMSVTVLGRDTTSHVEATVNGLRSGIQYRLYAVNVRGQTQVVADWLARDVPYAFSGDLDVPAADLAFFTVTQLDGAVVVTVHVAKSG